MILPDQLTLNTTKPLPEEADRALRFLFSLAHFVIVDQGKEIMPHYAMLGADGEKRVFDVSDIPIKQLQTMVVRHAAEQMKAVMVAMVTEGWTLPQALLKEHVENRSPEQGKISDHPEAFEVLCLHVETPEGAWMGQVVIAKDDAGVRSLSTEVELHDVALADVQGGMVGLLPEVVKARQDRVVH